MERHLKIVCVGPARACFRRGQKYFCATYSFCFDPAKGLLTGRTPKKPFASSLSLTAPTRLESIGPQNTA
jgi:hypothetical protein